MKILTQLYRIDILQTLQVHRGLFPKYKMKEPVRSEERQRDPGEQE